MPEEPSDEGVVRAYKRLARVERAFRHMKTADLQLRPFYVRKEERVRGHVMTCLLAYYLEWHMRRRLASLLYDEEEPERAVEGSPVMGSGPMTGSSPAETRPTVNEQQVRIQLCRRRRVLA